METIGDPHPMYSTLHGPGYSGKNGMSAKFDYQLIVERSPFPNPYLVDYVRVYGTAS